MFGLDGFWTHRIQHDLPIIADALGLALGLGLGIRYCSSI